MSFFETTELEALAHKLEKQGKRQDKADPTIEGSVRIICTRCKETWLSDADPDDLPYCPDEYWDDPELLFRHPAIVHHCRLGKHVPRDEWVKEKKEKKGKKEKEKKGKKGKK